MVVVILSLSEDADAESPRIDWWHVTEWLWEMGKIFYGKGKEETTAFVQDLETL